MGCRNRSPHKTRLYVFDTADFRVIPKPIADRMIHHKLALPVEEWKQLIAEGKTMKVKILRNGKICDMPTQNAEAYIKTGQAVAVEKAVTAPPKDKKVKSAPAKKALSSLEGEDVFVCGKCGKTYKTERGFKNHKCKK
jgi:hypothetical protein